MDALLTFKRVRPIESDLRHRRCEVGLTSQIIWEGPKEVGVVRDRLLFSDQVFKMHYDSTAVAVNVANNSTADEPQEHAES